MRRTSCSSGVTPPLNSLFEMPSQVLSYHTCSMSSNLISTACHRGNALSVHDGVTLWLKNMMRRSTRKGRIWLMMMVTVSMVGMMMNDAITWIKWEKRTENAQEIFYVPASHWLKSTLNWSQPMQEELKQLSFKAKLAVASVSTWKEKSRCCGLAGKNHLSCKQQNVGLLPGTLVFLQNCQRS